MTDRKLYVRAAEVPGHSSLYLTAGKLYEFKPKRPDWQSGTIIDDEGDEDFILTERKSFQCLFLYGTSACWEIVDADGNPVTPETEERE